MSRRRSSAVTCRVATPGKICCFCGTCEDNEIEFGKIYELGTIVTHYYCLLLSSMMQQKGRDDQGILGFLSADIEKEIRRGKRLVCYHCKKNGATLGCCNTKCKRIFHLPCGLKAGSLHQFYSEFRSYCINHRPKQLIDGRVLEEVQNAETTLCYICYDNVNYRDILAMLWAPCCKKNAFFHRKCVQQLANSSGYFFKCPLCNNKKEFQEAMLEHGIFIPSQDASWELVPNAFHELLYRHNQCDAETCVCPKGRSHSGSNAGPTNKWELVLCQVCGSQGIHRHCGHLKWTTSIWECDDCRSILEKSPHVNKQKQTDGAEGNAGNREASREIDSDSDLSVGHDSNEQSEKRMTVDQNNVPIIKVRPGPLSYKLKEVMKVTQSQPKTKGSSSSLEGTNSSSSLPNCDNGNKNVKDPKTVILLDSDEEADSIEIISEKLSPKVLTTNDGKKIEIFDKRGGNKFALNKDSREESSKPTISPTLLAKDSKPTITSIQTVNTNVNTKIPNQIPSLVPFNYPGRNIQNLFDKSDNRISSIVNDNQRPRIVTQQITVSGSTSQEFNLQSNNLNPKVALKPISPHKLTSRNSPIATSQNRMQQSSTFERPTSRTETVTQQISTPQNLNQQSSTSPNFTRQNSTSPNVTPSIWTPQKFASTNSTPQKFTPSDSTPQKFTPSNMTPQKFTPSILTPQKSTRSNSTPQKFTPSDSTPQKFTPSDLTPQKYIPSDSTPQKFAPSGFTPPNFTPSDYPQQNSSPQIFHLRSIGPQGLSKRLSNQQGSKTRNSVPVGLIQRNTISQTTANQGNEMRPEMETNFGKDSERNYHYGKTYEQSPSNFFPGNQRNYDNNRNSSSMNVDDSLGIKILNVCSLAPHIFEKLENQDESNSNSSSRDLKRKAETPGPSHIIDDGDEKRKEAKRSRIKESEIVSHSSFYELRDKLIGTKSHDNMENKNERHIFSPLRGLREMPLEMRDNLIGTRDNLNLMRDDNDKEIMENWRRPIEIIKGTRDTFREKREYSRGKRDLFNDKRDEKTVDNVSSEHSPILRNLVEQAMVNANITPENIIDEVQPSTSNVNAKSNNYPTNNVTYYLERGKTQEVLKIAGNNGACISWDSSNSVKGMQSSVLLFPQSMVFQQSVPSGKSDSKQKIKSPLKQIHNSETTQSKTPNLTACNVPTQKDVMNSTKTQAPVIQLD